MAAWAGCLYFLYQNLIWVWWVALHDSTSVINKWFPAFFFRSRSLGHSPHSMLRYVLSQPFLIRSILEWYKSVAYDSFWGRGSFSDVLNGVSLIYIMMGWGAGGIWQA